MNPSLLSVDSSILIIYRCRVNTSSYTLPSLVYHSITSLKSLQIQPFCLKSRVATANAIHCVAASSIPDDNNHSPPPPMKLQRALGVDYGRKFVGLAVSTLGFAPRPLKPLPGRGYEAIMQLADEVLQAALAEGQSAAAV